MGLRSTKQMNCSKCSNSNGPRVRKPNKVAFYKIVLFPFMIIICKLSAIYARTHTNLHTDTPIQQSNVQTKKRKRFQFNDSGLYHFLFIIITFSIFHNVAFFHFSSNIVVVVVVSFRQLDFHFHSKNQFVISKPAHSNSTLFTIFSSQVEWTKWKRKKHDSQRPIVCRYLRIDRKECQKSWIVNYGKAQGRFIYFLHCINFSILHFLYSSSCFKPRASDSV